MTTQAPSFRLVRMREGYDTHDVDTFIIEVLAEINAGRATGALADRIDQVRFTPTRIRQGYDMHDVDACLDELRQLALQGPRQT